MNRQPTEFMIKSKLTSKPKRLSVSKETKQSPDQSKLINIVNERADLHGHLIDETSRLIRDFTSHKMSACRMSRREYNNSKVSRVSRMDAH